MVISFDIRIFYSFLQKNALNLPHPKPNFLWGTDIILGNLEYMSLGGYFNELDIIIRLVVSYNFDDLPSQNP